jgi:hypothetical protein
MNEIAAAAAAGRVETLLIEAAPNSKITSDTGTIEGELNNPEMDDLLDDLGN